MKKLILALLICSAIYSSDAQSRRNVDWMANIGFNGVDNNGDRNPFSNPFDWEYGLPVSAAIEAKWESDFAIEQSVTFNRFGEVDGIELADKISYLSFDTHGKYYFGKHIFPNEDRFDFYVSAGLGIFTVDGDTNGSGNLGGGVLVWFDRRQTFGLRFQTIAKFAFDDDVEAVGLANNHFQTHLQLVFVL